MFASQKTIYATRLHFFFNYTDVCAFLRRIDRCAVPLHPRRFWLFSCLMPALTACNYCQNHPLPLSVNVIVSASAGAARYGMFVSLFLHFPQGLKRTSCSLHHWCNTPLSAAPIALCRYSCLQLASTPLAVAPTARWIHSPTHGNGGQRRLCGIPCACHQTSLGQLSRCPRHPSPHLRPPRHLSYHPRHQGHLFGPLQHFPPTPRPSMAKSWPRLVHAAKLFVRPKPETPLPRGA